MTNEAPWVYLKGLLAYSREEQELSMKTNVKKWFILDFPSLKERLLQLLEKNKENRFIFATLLEFAIAEEDTGNALKYLNELKVIDRLRENYYQWRINRI